MTRRSISWLVPIVLLATCVTASAQMFSRGNGLVNESAYALDRKDWDRGMILARDALKSGELMPGNLPAAYNNYCIGLTGLSRYDEALEACNKAISLRPRQWSFYNNRGNIYYFLGQYDRALAEYYKAMTFSPGDDVLLQNIALTLRVRKNRNPAAPASERTS
ncbi:MAG: tetratricopeptide repeat protein [Rhodobacteraceae bacterium]|nr:tetratricopeptide repeat protein [Paracoccaceae bacterium]